MCRDKHSGAMTMFGGSEEHKVRGIKMCVCIYYSTSQIKWNHMLLD